MVVVLVAALLVVALPTLASRGLEQKIETAFAKQENMTASWNALEVNYSGELELKGFHLEDKEQGVELDVERVYIKPSLSSIFEDQPEIDAIRVEGTLVQLEGRTWVDRFAGKKAEDSTSDEPRNEDKAGGKLSARLKGILANPPEVVIERARVQASLDDKPVVEFELTRGVLKGGGDEPLRVESQGYFTTQYEKIPKLLRQRHSWDAVFEYDMEKKHALLDVGSGDEGEALIDLELPRIARAKLDRLVVELDASRSKVPMVEAKDFFLKLGGRKSEDLIAQLTAESLKFSLDEGRTPHILGRSAVFEFTPSKFKELNNLRDRFKPLGGALGKLQQKSSVVVDGADDGGQDTEALAQLGRFLEWGERVNRVLGAVNVDLEQSALVMHVPLSKDAKPVPGGLKGLRSLRLIDDLDVSLDKGHLMMTGNSASGNFLADAIFLPGQALPHSATIVASGVDLAKLPGMEQGRTLPNRGIRGRLGGVVDFSMHMLTPVTGVQISDGGLFDEVMLRGALSWHDGMLDIHGVADEPLTGLELDVDGAFKWNPKRGEFTFEDSKVKYNGLEATMEASLKGWPLEPELRFVANMPETPCQQMVDALPRAMLGGYSNVTIDGKAAPSLWLKWPLNHPEHLSVELDGLAEEDTPTVRLRRRRRGEDEMVPSDKTYHCKITKLSSSREVWPEVEFRDAPGSLGQAKAKKRPPSWYNRRSQSDVYWLNWPFVKRVTEGVSDDAEIYVGPGLETYVPLSSLPPYVGGAMYLSEEILFPENKGVSFGLVRKAVRINLERGRFVYGGSTVTQQLVKNLFLTRDKTLSRKLQEALISLRMDEVVSKDRILELYLNCIEFGPDLYGIGPAAKHYFNKEAKDLTPMESLFLATIKPSPSYGEHLRKRGQLPGEKSWFIKRFGTVFKRMVKYEIMTEAEVEAAQRQTLKWEDGVYAPEYEEVPVEQVMEDLLKDMMSP